MGGKRSDTAVGVEVLYSGAAFCLLVPVLNVLEAPAAQGQIQTSPRFAWFPRESLRVRGALIPTLPFSSLKAKCCLV